MKAAERVTEAKLFHFNGFKHYLTLFSKFFPSFARATCLLSVSVEYLALPQIYEVLWTAISSNPTRSSNNFFRKGPKTGGNTGQFSFFGAAFQLTFTSRAFPRVVEEFTFLLASYLTADFHFELFPLRSPLLRESRLFSFPPLNKMLQFSGYSYSR